EGGDITAAAEFVYGSRKSLAIYVLVIGLETIKASIRREHRRELKATIKPQFQSGPVSGSIVFTKKTKQRIARHAARLFGPEGWAIGDVLLSDFTKEQMIERAEKERRSAKGNLQNAQFYEALAEPLQPGQLVGAYWNPETAGRLREKIWTDTESKEPRLT